MANPHRTLRPLWQIVILLSLYPIYMLAKKFVDFMDNV